MKHNERGRPFLGSLARSARLDPSACSLNARGALSVTVSRTISQRRVKLCALSLSFLLRIFSGAAKAPALSSVH